VTGRNLGRAVKTKKKTQIKRMISQGKKQKGEGRREAERVKETPK